MMMYNRSVNTIRFTKNGLSNLQKEHAELLAQRPAAVDDLKKARELGDLSENGYYRAARSKLSTLDGRLRRLSYYLKLAVIIDNTDKNTTDIGSSVVLSDGKKEMRFQIVGDLEAAPEQSKISLLSPIGRAIAGKKVGESTTVLTPSGSITYKIISIS